MKKTLIKLLTFLLLFPIAGKSQIIDNMSLRFDGNNDYVEISNSESLDIGTGDFTFEAVIKTAVNQVSFPQIISNRSTHFDGFLFGLYGAYDNSGRLYVRLADANLPIGGGIANLMDDQCHHVAVSRDVDSIRYFIDGFQVYAIRSSGRNISTNHNVWIGYDAPNTPATPFNGNIKEVRIWNVARQAEDILEYKDKLLNGNESGLILYCKLNEGSGDIVADYSPNAFSGLLGSTIGQDDNNPEWSTSCSLIEEEISEGAGSYIIMNYLNSSYVPDPLTNTAFKAKSGIIFTGGINGLNLISASGNISFTAGGMGSIHNRLEITSNGNVGIGTSEPVEKLQIADGDVYIEDIDKGVIMKSSNGSCWRITVGDDGSLITTLLLECPN